MTTRIQNDKNFKDDLNTTTKEKCYKKTASHPSSIREPGLDFRKLVDKLEQAEITMKLEQTANLKLQYVNCIETNTTHINNIQESDRDLSEKVTEILNIYEKNPNCKGKRSFKKWGNYCRRYGYSNSECRQKQQDNQNKPQKQKEPNKSFNQYMKKIKTWQTRIYSNNICGKLLPNNPNYSLKQLPYNSSYRGRSPEKEIREISHKTDIVDRIVELTIHDWNQTQLILFLTPVPNQTQGIDNIPTTDHETHRTTEIETIQTIGEEVTQTIEIRIIQTTDHGIIPIIDQTIRDQMITIRTDHEIIHETEIQVITADKETILSHLIGIITVTRILNQVQTNEETTSDTPGIDNTEKTELQLNHINSESTDSESDTDNNISVNMISVENDYETITYEPFNSHIYENQLKLLNNYYMGPIFNNTQITQELNEINTVLQSDKDNVQSSNTNHIYQNIQKEQPREKIWTIPFFLESPKGKKF